MSLIEQYNSIQHEILSDLSLKWVPKSESETFQQKVQKYYGFENEFGWNILLNAFYTIEDAEFAKQSFKRFGLQGPSRHEDIGEKYMRLYGVLNAIYQQKLAVQNLLEIHKIPAKKVLVKKLGEQKALHLRNKVAAHSTNHISQYTSGLSKFDVYEISRPDLKMNRIVLLKNQSEFEKYDLAQIIKDFDGLYLEILEAIISKVIKSIFMNKGKHFEALAELTNMREGTIKFGSEMD